MIKKPLLAEDASSFILFIAEKLNISLSQAKKDIEEVKRRRKNLSLIDLKEEIARKKIEYAFIKEEALKQKNLNAYILSLKILLTLCLQYENRYNNGITRDACRLCA